MLLYLYKKKKKDCDLVLGTLRAMIRGVNTTQLSRCIIKGV